MEKKISVKTLYLLLVISIGLIGLGVGSTYAVFTATAEIVNPIVFSSNLSYNSDVMETVEVTVGSGETKSTTLNISNSSGDNLNYSVWYVTSSNDIEIGTSSGTPTGTIASGGTTSLVVDIRNSGNDSVTVILGISSGSDSVVVGSDMKIVPSEELKPLLTTYINNLYTQATKTEVINNNITYNYATSVSLMNDRLGGTTSDYDAGNIRYYGANPNNYVDIGDVYTEETVIDNYQKNSLFLSFFGVSDSASCYTFFDCSTNYEAIGQIMELEFTDEAFCTAGLQNYYHISNLHEMCGTTTKAAGDPKLYRVIGLFKDVEMSNGTTQDLIKVIREDSIGNMAWDLTGTSEDDAALYNNWHDSTLQTILNGAYYNSAATAHSYFDFMSGSPVFGSTIDFAKSGLNNTVHDKIATVKWNLGGWNSNNIYSNQVYGYERGDVKCPDCTYETTWPGKVALMYPSDYGYATDFSSCSNTLANYHGDVDCYPKNFLFSLSNGNAFEWLLTPDFGNSYFAWYVAIGDVRNGNDVYSGVGVRPVFYLGSGLSIVSGNGSASTPYVIR